MKWGWLALLGVAGASSLQPNRETVLVITGDLRGELGPCGCAKPMAGGLLRLSTVIRQQTTGRSSSILILPDLVTQQTRQDEIKLDAIAETVRSWPATTAVRGRVHGLPAALESSFQSLSGATWVDPETRVPVGQTGWSVVAIDGGFETARRWKAKFGLPKDIVVFRSGGNAELLADGVVSPGAKTTSIVIVKFSGGSPKFQSLPLGPDVADDPVAARIDQRYLKRIRAENLLSQIVRSPSEPFAGSVACGSCHEKALNIWKHSAHAAAFKSLEKAGHDADPDCVPCHVVGARASTGYPKTKGLANVGCESCHGPSAAHALHPKTKTTGKSKSICLSCHDGVHSPPFDFGAMWAKIKH